MRKALRFSARMVFRTNLKILATMWLLYGRFSGEGSSGKNERLFMKPSILTDQPSAKSIEKRGESESPYQITILTFEKRQMSHAVPVVRELVVAAPGVPIQVFLNGNVEAPINQQKKSEFVGQLARLPYVDVLPMKRFHGCSQLWNLGVRLSSWDMNLIMNDDIAIDFRTFQESAAELMEITRQHGICLVNGEFSCFMVSRAFLLEFGWFEEAFLASGGEDVDFAARYLRRFGQRIPSMRLSGIQHLDSYSVDSYATYTRSKHSLLNQRVLRFLYGEVVRDWSDFEKISTIPRRVPPTNPHPLASWELDASKKLGVTEATEIDTEIERYFRGGSESQ